MFHVEHQIKSVEQNVPRGTSKKKDEVKTMRKFGVTKTIKTKIATVMCVNPETGEITNEDFSVKRLDDDIEKLCNRLRKVHDTTTRKLIKVLDISEKSERYGMTFDDFIAHATLLTDEAETETEVED